MEEDVERGQVPVMVLAYAGTPLAGHVEDMAAIRELCNKHTVWMHVLGSGREGGGREGIGVMRGGGGESNSKGD